MVIVFLLVLYIRMVHCQMITTTTTPSSPNFISNCSFLTDTYLSNAAVSDQFQFTNHTSIILTASYAFTSPSTFELGLIYQFSPSNYLVPFPVVFDCASVVHSCQLKTMTGTTITSRDSEPIRVQLTSFNYTKPSTSMQFNHMSLYLKQGRYQLSNCSINNDQQMTDPRTIFYIQIQNEKPVGTPCDPMSTTCGSSSLTTCSSSNKCACLSSSSSIVSYSDSMYCADMMNISNCRIFPSRCIIWCNRTTNYLCICPTDTLKIQRNNIFFCELPVNADNCSLNDDVRRCSFGQCCINGQCLDCSMATTTTTSRTIDIIEYSMDERLRIALGVIAGLLVTSVTILLGAFCWLRHKHKLCRLTAEKSLQSSSSSSLYISPIQQQCQGKYSSSISPIYHLSYNHENASKTFYRTESFRQAVELSGHREKQIIEHVSTKRDSFINEKDGWSSPTFSTLEYVIPTVDNDNTNNNNNNSYPTIIPSTAILTHAV